jgi:tetratricopeptide (TPR) repeat protein
MAAEHDEDMPAHVAAAQRACLDDRQRSLRVFVEEIEQSHGRLLGRLLTRVGELPDVAMCRDRAYVLRRYNVAALADRWPRVEAVREALAESERAYWAGDLEGSRRHADEAYRVANELQDGELRARALFWQAMFDLRRGANNESRDRLIEGLLAALRAGADDVARHCATGATAAASEGGKLELAELLGGVALALDDRLDGQGTDGYRTLGVLARVYESQGRMDEALRAGEESHRWAQRQLSEDDPHLGVSHENLGGMYHRSGRFEEALRHTRAAIEIARRTEGEHSAAYVWARVAYAGTLGYLGEHAAAEDVVLDAKRLLEEAGRTQTGQYSGVLADLAELARWQGRYQEALELGREAVRIQETIDGPRAPWLSHKLAQVGWAEFELGDFEAALVHFERAMQGQALESPRNRADFRWAVSRTLTALHRDPDRALSLANEAVEHCAAAGPGHADYCKGVRAWRDELAGVESRRDSARARVSVAPPGLEDLGLGVDLQ